MIGLMRAFITHIQRWKSTAAMNDSHHVGMAPFIPFFGFWYVVMNSSFRPISEDFNMRHVDSVQSLKWAFKRWRVELNAVSAWIRWALVMTVYQWLVVWMLLKWCAPDTFQQHPDLIAILTMMMCIFTLVIVIKLIKATTVYLKSVSNSVAAMIEFQRNPNHDRDLTNALFLLSGITPIR